MNYIGKCLTNFKEFYNEINAATLTGAIDVIIVKQKDGTYLTSPFHVRFGKIGVLKSKEKVVDIEINGVPVDIHMKLGETGEAFFVAPLSVGEQLVSFDLATSPLPLEMLQQHSPLSAEVATNRSCQHDDRQVDGRQLDANEPTGAVGGQLSPTAAPAGDDVTGQQQEEGSTEVMSAVEVSSDEPEPAPECDLVQQEQSSAAGGVDASFSCPPHHLQQPQSNFLPIAPTAEGVVPVDSAPERTKRRRQRRRKSARQHQRSFSDTRMLAEVMQQAVAAPNSADSGPRSASLATPTAILETFHTFQPECHPFSDTDISPPSSRRGSRSPSPIKSDTEFEVERERALTDHTERRPSAAVWQWGELPSSTPAPSSTFSPSSALSPSAAEESHVDSASSAASPSAAVSRAEQERSVLAGVFSFMRKTKKVRHDPLSEGIYLDDLDLDALDPEVAALYFPRSRTAACSQGSGRGGLRHSTYALDDDEGNGSSAPNSPQPPPADVALSLCGQCCADGLPASETLFLQSLVSYDDLAADPGLLQRPELIVRIDGRYYSWQVAAPQLACLLAFGRPLPSVATQLLEDQHRSASDANRSESVSPPVTSVDVATTPVAATPVKKSNSIGYSSWFSWRRQSGPDAEEDVPADLPTESVEGAPEQQQLASESPPTDAVSADCSKEAEGVAHDGVDQVDTRSDEESPVKDSAVEINAVLATETDIDSKVTHQAIGAENPSIATSEDGGASAQVPTELSSDEKAAALGRRSECTDLRISESDDVAAELSFDQNEQMYKKSLRLTSEQVERLGLHEGQNEVVFSVTTAYQGTSRCRCNIFLWRYDDKLVISDIDGTITKSDVLGHILPMIGQHWAQSGVAALFSKIRDNGYKFLYLSARAIGQAPITREYLRSVKQGTVCLPEGPLLLSPSSLVSAFHREVIEKRPEDFKIPCLRDIQTLFPGGNPLYAGYGNRVNDAFSYRAVGIPYSRIFTINHRGELRHELTHTFQSSYTSLTDMVDHFFPPSGSVGGQVDAQEFNNFCYWRLPLPSVSDLPPLE